MNGLRYAMGISLRFRIDGHELPLDCTGRNRSASLAVYYNFEEIVNEKRKKVSTAAGEEKNT